MSPSNDNQGQQPPVHCPICSKAPNPAYSPFCSKRCADVDLHRWLTGSYAIPAVEDDGDIDGEPIEDGH